MGVYLNPGNEGFSRILGADYVDKSGLIAVINEKIQRDGNLILISRPRRFGKSYAAKMLTAYYDCSCDSRSLFDQMQIAKSSGYEKYLNQFHVISLDISGFVSEAKSLGKPLQEIPARIAEAIHEDLSMMDPEAAAGRTLNEQLIRFVENQGGKQIVFVIDEWDAVIREAKENAAAQDAYLSLLRSWFKNGNFTPKVVAAAYMTGILPIKKDGSQSAISDFKEYTILHPGKFAEYTGFTEPEVHSLCERHQINFEEMKDWYDGYGLPGVSSVYNPYSVMRAAEEGTCRSFWGKTSASEALTDYINMDFDGLQETVAKLISGDKVSVNTSRFQNDFEHFRSADDVLTLLIHLGYLTFDSTKEAAYIPNEEVRMEFRNFLEDDSFSDAWVRLIRRSQNLLQDTFEGNEEAVSRAISEIRLEQYAPQYYNNEQSLRAVIKYAYLAALGRYIRVEEMPSGKGVADVVFIPKPYTRDPAMLVELKWNQSAEGALKQIRDRQYTAVLQPFAGNVVLVGIDYDEKTKEHSCRIERA